MKALVNISGEKEADLKKELTQSTELPDIKGNIIIAMYTKGFNNDVVKVTLGDDKSEPLAIVETSKNNYEMKLSAEGFEFKCNVKTDGSKNTEMKCSTEIEKIKLGYTMNIKVDDNYKLEKPAIKEDELVKFEDVNEEDVGKIMENLTNKDAVKELMGVVSSLMEQFSGNVDVEPIVEEPIEEIG